MYIFGSTIKVSLHPKIVLYVNNIEKSYIKPRPYKEFRMGSPG